MELKDYAQKLNLYLFDMDGTLYLGNRLFDFTLELLDTLKATGRKYLFMTNNSSKSVNDYVKKLKNLGIEATQDDFMTSSQATAYYLHKHHEVQKLYVCGTESLKEELRMEGFTGILVLSGETTCEILEKSPDKPHLVLQDAGEILSALKNYIINY